MSTISPGTTRKIEAIMQHVLKEVKPSEQEIKVASAISNEVMGRLKRAVPKNVDIILAGSVARGTQIRGNSDIDIFLLFPKAIEEREMEKKGLEVARKIVDKKKGERFVIKYAEHPYLQILMKNPPIKADIVPAFKITDSSEMGSAVDRTQLHNKFVMNHLGKEQRDHVRLLKAFMRFHNVYGAEAKVEGFSGYLCELLMYHFGSFVNVFNEFSTMKFPICIDPKNKQKLKQEEIFKKFNSDFVVIDPTDVNRNVAAGVSKESLARFVYAARAFLQEPTLKLFYGPEYSTLRSKEKITAINKELGTDTYVLHFVVPDMSEDIIWQQLKKFSRRLTEKLEKNSFKPIFTVMDIDERDAIIAFFVNKHQINSVTREGPSIFMKDASDAFTKKHKRLYVKEDKLVSIEKSKYNTPKELIEDEIKSPESIFPSYLKKKSTKLIINNVPEKYASLIYGKYMELTSI